MLLVLPLRKAEDDQLGFKPYRSEHTDFEPLSMSGDTLRSWNEHVGLHPADYTSAMIGKAPVKATIYNVEHEDNGVKVKHALRDPNGEHVGFMERSMGVDQKTGDKVAYHHQLKLEEPFQRKGIGTELLKSQIGHYQQQGVDRVHLYAGMQNGGYTWAKMGFHPDEDDEKYMHGLWREHVNSQLENTPSGGGAISPEAKARTRKILQNPDPKAIWDIADQSEHVGAKITYHPSGDPAKDKKVPIKLGEHLLAGSGWYGKLDLRDPEATDRFHNYTQRKQGGSNPSEV